MRKKELAITLEGLKGFKNPKVELEQYVTPPGLASEIVITASLMGDLEFVMDLGCGTGILAIASAMLGAKALGFDIDREALITARENAEALGVYVDFVQSRVEDVCVKRRGTVIMNPPFGIKRRHADRPFLEKAMEIGEVIYSIHSAGSEGFVRHMCSRKGFLVTHVWRYRIPLKRTYSFHEREYKWIAVEVFRIERVR